MARLGGTARLAAFGWTFTILKAMRDTLGLRISDHEESCGLDPALRGQAAPMADPFARTRTLSGGRLRLPKGYVLREPVLQSAFRCDGLVGILERPRNLLRALGKHWPARRARRVKLNLALQGGGAHGAFTWGVLDRLLEEEALSYAAISGTSAGAVNAVLLAAGLLEGRASAARAKLDRFWREIGRMHAQALSGPVAERLGFAWSAPATLEAFSRVLSPYQWNPLNVQPLRHCLQELVPFGVFSRPSRLKIYVAATEVSSGRARIFGNEELTVDALLASAALPQLHHAVRIGDADFWDGGFTANPALLPLLDHARDTLLVQILPMEWSGTPYTAAETEHRIREMIFTEPLRREFATIRLARRFAADRRLPWDRKRRRYLGHRFHRIDGSTHASRLPPSSRALTDWKTLQMLREAGRQAAGRWIEERLPSVGRQETCELAFYD